MNKNSKTTETSTPIDYKSIPTNVNTGGDIVVTVWKESEVAKMHEMLVQKMKQEETSGSEPTLHLKETPKTTESTETSTPIEYKSIPTNVNTGGDIIATIWRDHF